MDKHSDKQDSRNTNPTNYATPKEQKSDLNSTQPINIQRRPNQTERERKVDLNNTMVEKKKPSNTYRNNPNTQGKTINNKTYNR